MRLRLPVLVFGILVGLPLCARAEEKYDIKVKKSIKGDIERVVEEEKGVRKMQLKVGAETIKDEKESSQKFAKYQKEVLEVDDKDNVIRQARIYDKGSETKDGESTDFRFLGKKVLIEKTKGAKKPYRFTYEGGKELSEEEAAPLDKEFNKDKDDDDDKDFEKMLLPGKKVELNESWKVDVKGMFSGKQQKELDMDLDKATGKARLVKAYKKGERQYGVIEIQMEIPIKAIKGEDSLEIKMKKGTIIAMKVQADMCIDGTSGSGTMKMTTKIRGEGTGKLMDQDFVLNLDAEETMIMTGEDVEKK